jgi:hypothetical protein
MTMRRITNSAMCLSKRLKIKHVKVSKNHLKVEMLITVAHLYSLMEVEIAAEVSVTYLTERRIVRSRLIYLVLISRLISLELLYQ